MSLMKLLSVSKSFAGGINQTGRYKMAEQGLLPKFAPMGRPVSLAPKRNPDDPAAKQESNGTPVLPANSAQQQFLRAARTVAEPAKTVAQRSAVCVNATAATTNWFRLGNNPFVNRRTGMPEPLAPQVASKNGAGTASSPHWVGSAAFDGDEPSPPLVAPVLRRNPLALPQAELSLDAVKPVRNDLSDSDLQIVPARPEIKTDSLKPPPPRWLRPELTGLAWSRLTSRFFNSERIRA